MHGAAQTLENRHGRIRPGLKTGITKDSELDSSTAAGDNVK
jgi:hypothetical protein